MFRDLSDGDEGDADDDAPIKWPTGPNPRPFQGIYTYKPPDDAKKPGDPPTAPGGATGTAPGATITTGDSGDSGDLGDSGDSGVFEVAAAALDL